MSVLSLASKLATKVAPLATKVASKVPSTPLTGYLGNKLNQAGLFLGPNKAMPASKPFNSAVAKDAALTAASLFPVGKATSLLSKLPGVSSLASKMAAPTVKASTLTVPKYVAPGTMTVPKYAGSTNIASLTKPTTSPITKLTQSTTAAKNANKIDTAIAPKVAPTATRTFPVAKTAVYGGLGLGAYSLANSGGETTGELGRPLAENPLTGFATQETPTANAQTGGDYSVDSAFGDTTTQNDFSTPSSFGTPEATTSFFSAGAPVSAGGSYSSLGGAPAGMAAGGVTGKSARQQALEELMRKYDEGQNTGEQTSEESALEKKIADIEALKQNLNLDLETSSSSAYGQNAQTTLLDRETRRSLIPLQTSLALFQAERQREEEKKEKGFDREKYMFEQMYPQEDTTKYPASVQEYQFAQQQGYKGTYQEFAKEMNDITSTSTNTADKVLTPSEAADLGVPYGTTQSQAYGQNPTKLSGDAAKILAITETIVPEINQLKQRFQQDYRGALTGYLTGTDRELVKLVDQVADKVGRLRSGGAVNADEEMRFKRQIASIMDLPFGEAQQAISALDNLINEAEQVSQSVNPSRNQQSTSSDWSW